MGTPRIKRVWLLLCEGSIAATFQTAWQAEAARRARRDAGCGTGFSVEGPFLRGRTTKGVRR